MSLASTATHVAGPPVGMQSINRIVQRCAVCGEKLCDSKGAMMPRNPDGSPPVFPTFEPGALIRVEGDSPRRYTPVGHFEDCERELPHDFCIDLVE